MYRPISYNSSVSSILQRIYQGKPGQNDSSIDQRFKTYASPFRDQNLRDPVMTMNGAHGMHPYFDPRENMRMSNALHKPGIPTATRSQAVVPYGGQIPVRFKGNNPGPTIINMAPIAFIANPESDMFMTALFQDYLPSSNPLSARWAFQALMQQQQNKELVAQGLQPKQIGRRAAPTTTGALPAAVIPQNAEELGRHPEMYRLIQVLSQQNADAVVAAMQRHQEQYLNRFNQDVAPPQNPRPNGLLPGFEMLEDYIREIHNLARTMHNTTLHIRDQTLGMNQRIMNQIHPVDRDHMMRTVNTLPPLNELQNMTPQQLSNVGSRVGQIYTFNLANNRHRPEPSINNSSRESYASSVSDLYRSVHSSVSLQEAHRREQLFQAGNAINPIATADANHLDIGDLESHLDSLLRENFDGESVSDSEHTIMMDYIYAGQDENFVGSAQEGIVGNTATKYTANVYDLEHPFYTATREITSGEFNTLLRFRISGVKRHATNESELYIPRKKYEKLFLNGNGIDDFDYIDEYQNDGTVYSRDTVSLPGANGRRQFAPRSDRSDTSYRSGISSLTGNSSNWSTSGSSSSSSSSSSSGSDGYESGRSRRTHYTGYTDVMDEYLALDENDAPGPIQDEIRSVISKVSRYSVGTPLQNPNGMIFRSPENPDDRQEFAAAAVNQAVANLMISYLYDHPSALAQYKSGRPGAQDGVLREIQKHLLRYGVMSSIPSPGDVHLIHHFIQSSIGLHASRETDFENYPYERPPVIHAGTSAAPSPDDLELYDSSVVDLTNSSNNSEGSNSGHGTYRSSDGPHTKAIREKIRKAHSKPLKARLLKVLVKAKKLDAIKARHAKEIASRMKEEPSTDRPFSTKSPGKSVIVHGGDPLSHPGPKPIASPFSVNAGNPISTTANVLSNMSTHVNSGFNTNQSPESSIQLLNLRGVASLGNGDTAINPIISHGLAGLTIPPIINSNTVESSIDFEGNYPEEESRIVEYRRDVESIESNSSYTSETPSASLNNVAQSLSNSNTGLNRFPSTGNSLQSVGMAQTVLAQYMPGVTTSNAPTANYNNGTATLLRPNVNNTMNRKRGLTMTPQGDISVSSTGSLTKRNRIDSSIIHTPSLPPQDTVTIMPTPYGIGVGGNKRAMDDEAVVDTVSPDGIIMPNLSSSAPATLQQQFPNYQSLYDWYASDINTEYNENLESYVDLIIGSNNNRRNLVHGIEQRNFKRRRIVAARNYTTDEWTNGIDVDGGDDVRTTNFLMANNTIMAQLSQNQYQRDRTARANAEPLNDNLRQAYNIIVTGRGGNRSQAERINHISSSNSRPSDVLHENLEAYSSRNSTNVSSFNTGSRTRSGKKDNR